MTKQGGIVYFGESTRRDGSRKIYTGMTRRPVRKRWGEHINSQKYENKRTWVSKGGYFKPLGAVYSKNPEKAERTIKNLKSYQKKYLARGGAMRYNQRESFW